MEEFSGIPVKALLENDENTTKLDLQPRFSSSAFGSDFGCSAFGGGGYDRPPCGVTEACVLAECLKVLSSFLFSGVFVECFSVLPLSSPVTQKHGGHLLHI